MSDPGRDEPDYVREFLQGDEPDVSPLGDDALALDFTRRHGRDWRYVSAWGRWYTWTGSRWVHEETLKVFDLARDVARDAAITASPRLRPRITSAQTRNAIVSLAQADRAHAATAEQWDRDAFLLGTPAGVIDLRTGLLRDASREDYITKSTSVSAADMPTPVWDAFLSRVAGGDQQLAAFLQRFAGYSLTGSVREQALLFLYGTGANGKSTFVNVLSSVLGDYATPASMETFVQSMYASHPTDLASLRGARLVSAEETEDGRRWAESRLKSLTGGTRVVARHMRQDFFSYEPQFKLLLSGNHRPSLRNVDEAIRRRFHLVPFTTFIPPSERDAKLPEKLRAEAPGILTWMIRGCLAWQAEGLCPPESVTAATVDYLEAEDALGRWLEDCCDLGPQYEDTSKRLFESWKAWATAAEEYVGSQRRLVQRLAERGCQRDRTGPGRGLRGVRVRP